MDEKYTAKEEISDEDLAVLAVNEPAYFGEIMKRYEKPLARYIKRTMPSFRESVDDVLQEVFLKTYMHLKDFDRSRKFSSWIYRITHNYLVSALRKESIRPKIVSLDGGATPGTYDRYLADETLDQSDATYAKEEVDRVMISIPENDRKILFMWFVEEKRYHEIAQILDKPIGTVGVLIRRAKNRFKEQYVLERDSREKKAGIRLSRSSYPVMRLS